MAKLTKARLQAQIKSLEYENRRLREALFEQRIKPGVRWVICRLHRRAREMNHYPAKQWLNSLGFELGVYLNHYPINFEEVLDKAAAAALPSPPEEDSRG